MMYNDQDGRKKPMNAVIFGISFLFAVGIFVKFIHTMKVYEATLPGAPPEPELPNLAHKSRHSSVEAICSTADYISTCKSSLASVSTNSNVTTKDFVQAAFSGILSDMKSVVGLSRSLSDSSGIKGDHNGLNACNELISLGVHGLEAALAALLNSNGINTLNELRDDVKSWVSGVIAYQQACLDGLDGWDIKSKMNNALQKAKKMSSNVLSIIDSILFLDSTFEETRTRKSLSDTGIGNKDYPSWFSSSDRKLLESDQKASIKPDAVVAADGTGQFKTISEALKAYKANKEGRYVIYVKAGHYNETVIVTTDQVSVYMYGDGRDRTVVSGSKYSEEGVPAYQTATFAVLGSGFVCKSMTFRNNATSGREAVALRVQADKAVFFNCTIEGYQGTLYALAQRQFYRECIISGCKDIIFGDSTTIIQKSQILVRNPPPGLKFNMITAQGRIERLETTGFVLHDCTITQEQESSKEDFKIRTYLGRSWKRHSRTIIMQSYLGEVIDPQGWARGCNRMTEDKVFYAEYQNRGPGANTNKRVTWRGYKVITDKSEALQYTPRHFIQGNLWLNRSGVPYEPELV